jgi:hypothetical protein
MATKPKLPARKTQAPKQAPKQAPRQAPLDLVRNPNFDAALAQQNYQNLLSDAQANNFTQGRLMGAPTPQDNRKPMYISAMEAALQRQFMDENPQLRPPAGKAFDPEILSRNNIEFQKYRMGLNQKYYNDVGQFIPEDQKKFAYPKFLESVVDPSKASPQMAANLARLRSEYGKINASPISVTTPPPVTPVTPVIPSNQFNPNVGPRYRGGMNDNKLKAPGSPQQMQDYNKMLQQGMQNNSSNQAMTRLI